MNKCKLCDSVKNKLIYSKTVKTEREPLNLLQCQKCGFVFGETTPAIETLMSFYDEQGGAVKGNDLKRFNKKNKSLEKPLTRKMLKAYKGYGFFTGKINLLEKPFLKVLSFLTCKNIIPFEGEGKILDVGCNSGMYLAILKRIGWKVYGVEIEPSLAKDAKNNGVDVFCGTLRQAKFPDKFFDVIRFNEVFEHVEDPIAELKEAKKILKDNGKIYIEVPNQRSLSFYLFKDDFYGWPMHLHIFSPKTLGMLCEKHGLKIKHIKMKCSAGLFSNCSKTAFERLPKTVQNILGPFLNWKLLKGLIRPFCLLLAWSSWGDIFEAEIEKVSV